LRFVTADGGLDEPKVEEIVVDLSGKRLKIIETKRLEDVQDEASALFMLSKLAC